MRKLIYILCLSLVLSSCEFWKTTESVEFSISPASKNTGGWKILSTEVPGEPLYLAADDYDFELELQPNAFTAVLAYTDGSAFPLGAIYPCTTILNAQDGFAADVFYTLINLSSEENAAQVKEYLNYFNWQRLMTEWKEEGDEQQYDTLLAAAAEAEIKTIIPVDAKEFQNPKSMQAAICDYCAAHGLEVPQTKAATTRIVLQSLAAKYAEATAHLNAMLPTPIKKLHIIGGGSQNKLLNRLTEEALGVPVEAGPVEATAIGNILCQALAKGEVESVAEMRKIEI